MNLLTYPNSSCVEPIFSAGAYILSASDHPHPFVDSPTGRGPLWRSEDNMDITTLLIILLVVLLLGGGGFYARRRW